MKYGVWSIEDRWENRDENQGDKGKFEETAWGKVSR